MTCDRPGGFEADLDALADLGWGPDKLDALGRLTPGQFADFRALDAEAREHVIRCMEGTLTDADYARFGQRSDAQVISRWMLTLPAFQGDLPDDD